MGIAGVVALIAGGWAFWGAKQQLRATKEALS
jgi:hypothetical protein